MTFDCFLSDEPLKRTGQDFYIVVVRPSQLAKRKRKKKDVTLPPPPTKYRFEGGTAVDGCLLWFSYVKDRQRQEKEQCVLC